jgi:hypothetical protein
MWPEADEDKLRACAQAWRDFGADLARINQDTRLVAAQVTADNSGESIDAFEQYWHGVGGGGGDFERAKEAAGHMASALDGMAILVEGVKIAIIAQLGLLAAEIIADQLAAPETLGLSEGAGVAEVLVTRGIVRRIIQGRDPSRRPRDRPAAQGPRAPALSQDSGDGAEAHGGGSYRRRRSRPSQAGARRQRLS